MTTETTTNVADGLSALFTPLRIGSREAGNRIFRAATSTKLAVDNSVSPELLAHYKTVAEGGAAVIVTEAIRFHPSAVKSPGGIAAFSETAVPGLARWADTVHDAGALIVGQLNHSGRQHTSTKIPGALIGPSAIACPRSGGIPHEMSVDEIQDFVRHFGLAARHLAAAGFDGIEVHCAQGHLLQQFLSPFSNQRNDDYGGDPGARSRFPTEVLRAVREVVGADVVVGLRLGVDEFSDGGLTVDMTSEFASNVIGGDLIDYVSLSQGNFNTIDTHLPDRHYPHLPFAAEQGRFNELVSGVPVVACTRIVTPAEANEVITSGMADAVALSRALIVDPDWPRKARNGDREVIRLCIGCNECWDGLHEGTARISCVQNASAGRELALGALSPAPKRRRVVVVGGGPAGLETARVAAERGHDVTLLEASDTLGGKVRSGGLIAGHDDLLNVVRYLEPQVIANGVTIETGHTATIDTISRLEPEAVVVATGSTPIASPLPGDGSIASHGGLPDLPNDLGSRRVVIVDQDGHYWAAQVAEEISGRGAEVIVMTRFFEPFRELPSVSRIAALRVLDSRGVRFLTSHAPVESDSSNLRVKQFESGRVSVIDGVSDVIWVGPQRINDQLASEVRDAMGVEVVVIGDASSPRRIKNAIYEGNAAGRGV